MKLSIRAAAFILVFLLLPGLADAGSIRVCNKTNEVVYVAYLNDNKTFNIWGSAWTIRGWFELDPGDGCVSIDNAMHDQRAFFTVLTGPKDSNDRWLLKAYPVGDIDSGTDVMRGWSGVRGVQEFFCVHQSEAFERGVSSTAAAKRCPSGHTKQLFTLEIRARFNTFYTLDID